MFVGVVVENFHKCQACQEKEEKLRRENARLERLELRWKRTNVLVLLCLLLVFTADVLYFNVLLRYLLIIVMFLQVSYLVSHALVH